MVAIIEPDSLPNVVTNQSLANCQTATQYYETGIEYALNKLHAIPNVYNYMDIAHSAWLGWPSNMSATPAVYNTVVKATTAGYNSIDGFISDTANYTPVQEPFLTPDAERRRFAPGLGDVLPVQPDSTSSPTTPTCTTRWSARVPVEQEVPDRHLA